LSTRPFDLVVNPGPITNVLGIWMGHAQDAGGLPAMVDLRRRSGDVSSRR
jgi:hypothetical protein